MQVGRIFDIFAAIVTVALAWVIVSSPNTANIMTAWGSAFSSSLKVATGR